MQSLGDGGTIGMNAYEAKLVVAVPEIPMIDC